MTHSGMRSFRNTVRKWDVEIFGIARFTPAVAFQLYFSDWRITTAALFTTAALSRRREKIAAIKDAYIRGRANCRQLGNWIDQGIVWANVWSNTDDLIHGLKEEGSYRRVIDEFVSFLRGEVLREGDDTYVYVSDLPENFRKIWSALGDIQPREPDLPYRSFDWDSVSGTSGGGDDDDDDDEDVYIYDDVEDEDEE